MDEDYAIATKYNVYSPIRILNREFLGVKRVTFLIGEDGRIEAIFGGREGSEKVRTKEHADQVAKHWELKL